MKCIRIERSHKKKKPFFFSFFSTEERAVYSFQTRLENQHVVWWDPGVFFLFRDVIQYHQRLLATRPQQHLGSVSLNLFFDFLVKRRD